jgi:hypothetical protein
MLRDMLDLTTVQVSRETVTPDGMGGVTTATTAQTLLRAAIWQAGTGNRWMSDRLTRASTHVLAVEPAAYVWTQDDRAVIYGGATYKIIGRPDNIMGKDEILIVPLELQS